MREPDSSKPAGSKAPGMSLRRAVRSYRVLMAFGFRAAPVHATVQLVTGVIMALAAPAGAYGAKLLVDAATEHDASRGYVAAGVLASTVSVAIVMSVYYTDAVFTVFDRAGAYADEQLMRLMGGIPGLEHHENPAYLDQVERIREERGGLAGMVNSTAGLLRVLTSLGASGALLASVQPVLLLLPLFGVISFLAGKRSRDLIVAAEEQTSEAERLRRHLFDVATAPDSGKELRVFGTADELLRRHRAVADKVITARNRADYRGAALQAGDGVLFGLAYAVAIGVAIYRAVHGQASTGDVVLTVSLAGGMSGIVFTAVAYGTSFLRTLTLARRFVWLQDAAAAAGPAIEAAAVETLPERLRHGIELRDVSFRYPGTDRPILEHLDLHLEPGTVVAVVGENGAGKTSLIKVLGGFYPPTHGHIFVDGADLGRVPPEQWRHRVSAAFQDHAAFEFLAGETVGVADLPRIDDAAAVEAALERAGGGDVLRRLPAGLATQLGRTWEDGVDLSGGQWQKLALGRALLRPDPLLLVLDEPTAAIDAQTEHELFERFAVAAREGGGTGQVTVLVTHRFSTVRMADLIVVLDGGRIVERGRHDELVDRGGLYAELYDLQSRAYR